MSAPLHCLPCQQGTGIAIPSPEHCRTSFAADGNTRHAYAPSSALETRCWPAPGTPEALVVASRLTRLADSLSAERDLLADVIDGPVSSGDLAALRTAVWSLRNLADDLRTA